MEVKGSEAHGHHHKVGSEGVSSERSTHGSEEGPNRENEQ